MKYAKAVAWPTNVSTALSDQFASSVAFRTPTGAPTAESTDSHLPIHHLAPQPLNHAPKASPATRKEPNQVPENRADLVTSARIQSQIFIQIRSPRPNSENQVHNFMKPDLALPMRIRALVLEGEKLMNPSFSADYLKERRTREYWNISTRKKTPPSQDCVLHNQSQATGPKASSTSKIPAKLSRSSIEPTVSWATGPF